MNTNWKSRIAALAILLAGLTLLALPAGRVQAQGDQPPTPATTPVPPGDRPQPDGPARLERALVRQQTWLDVQADRFERVAGRITRLQDLIARLQEQGLDTAPLEAALADFQTATTAAGVSHDTAARVLAAHAGFDDTGHLTDRDLAVETLETAGAALDEARDGLEEAFEALGASLREFRRLHPPQPDSGTQP